MTSPDYLALLKKNDLSSSNHPPGFDRAVALGEVDQLRTSFESHLGYRPVLDDQVQDATHFAELQMQPKISRELHAVIRFSKFGRLVTILFAEKLGDEKLQLVLHELQKHGYVYVPSEILESPYDGQMQGIETWMTRFFYYV
jgi:hypothetical protein